MTTPLTQIAEGRRQGAAVSVFPRRKRKDSGAALLIVLVFILIISVVLVAFLSNSQRALQQTESSSTILKTELLGEVATAAIIDDLTDEMRAGADQDQADGAAMVVTKPWAMVPSRVLKESSMVTDTKFANLVKQSVNGAAFFTGTAPYRYEGKKRASAAGSLDESRNQRKVSALRWNKPKLVGDATGLGSFKDNQLPDWIYITRAGAVESGATLNDASNKAPSNTNYVLGRFAYNIYRVDGLLDINVAGYDSSDVESTKAAALKGSQALADLRALPGLDDSGAVRGIINWRNKETNSDYISMIAGRAPGAPDDATPGRWGEPGGFFQPYTDGSRTDNHFFSRQDLLNYFDHEFGVGSSQEMALPYLTTFSADLNQPTFSPDTNRPKIKRSAMQGGNDAFGDEGQPPAQQINPPVLQVLDDDETVVIKRRFPLDRLRYVFPSPDEPDKVAEYFGLRWSSIDEAWIYVDGDSIKRLNQIQNNEPNMIEMLKAGIAIGSLGGQLANSNEAVGSPRLIGGRDASINYQIMRIAACIIDQYDSDNYPTRIKFGSYMAYGDENLPYLYGMRAAPYRQEKLVPATAVKIVPGYPYPPAATDTLYRSVVMIQPVIWNPHAPLINPSGAPMPKFRITAKSGTDVQPVARKAWWIPSASTAYRSDWPSQTGNAKDISVPISFSPANDYITFQVSPSDGDKASFREPYVLKSPNYPPGSDAKSFTTGGEFSEFTLSTAEQNDAAQTDEQDNRAIGFRAGWTWSGPYQSGATSTNQTFLQEGRVSTNGIDFELQYESATGNWITYDSLSGLTFAEPYRLDRMNSGADFVNPRYMRYYLRSDPRVDRYGLRAPLLVPREHSTAGLPQGRTIRNDEGNGLAASAGWPTDPSIFNFSLSAAEKYFGSLSENKADSSVRYGDPDDTLRVAMGGFSSGVNGLPLALVNFSSRPVILNRPFRSVADLGYVLRDQPWKPLDFFSPQSGDAALLDMFCIHEQEDATAEPLTAGRVNLNTSRPEVIEALLRGVELANGVGLNPTQAKTIANALVNWTSSADQGKGPLRNRSEIVGKYSLASGYTGFISEAVTTLAADGAVAERRQNALRGLIDPGTTRTWTFLIDLIVQDGQFARAGGAANDFAVRGEKRYWVQLSMDRFTGEVTAEHVEEVNE